MGGGVIVKVPDYKLYKVEDCPQLMKCQQKLAEKGLKDPWARNHVWRYRNELTNHSRDPFIKIFARPGTVRGGMLGLATVAAYIVADQIYGLATGRSSGHHGDGHNEEH